MHHDVTQGHQSDDGGDLGLEIGTGATGRLDRVPEEETHAHGNDERQNESPAQDWKQFHLVPLLPFSRPPSSGSSISPDAPAGQPQQIAHRASAALQGRLSDGSLQGEAMTKT